MSHIMGATIGAKQSRPSRTSLSDVRQSILELVVELQRIDIRMYEALALSDQVRRILPLATSLVTRGEQLIALILGSWDATAMDTLPPGLSFELMMDAAVKQSRTRVIDVGDVAFFAHLELQQRKQRLAEVGAAPDAITLLSECDGALRRLHKALGALDTAIASATGTPAWLDFTPELERSLRVRRCYARLRERVLATPEPSCATLLARLRGVGTTIAVLVGNPVYAELRVGDRLQLRAVQWRVLSWLARHKRDPDSERAGFELWSDFKAFVMMLQQVNQRQELLEHDAGVLREATSFAVKSGELDFSPALLGQLDLLFGVDPDLDLLLKKGPSAPSSLWLTTLEQLCQARAVERS
jgi:hypothetical protein